MDVTIISRRESAKREQQAVAKEQSERLTRYFKNIVRIEWHLDDDGTSALVQCHLHAGHAFYRATTDANNFESAIHLAADTLIEQRRRKKQQRVRGRRVPVLQEVA
ncbi:MAG: HPF/RaiA family ribosome-associated protein [Deltaproteobacteria bacterium]|nr:HPF/RaiA family ribosome-associated protein [Deltaproteobacteria bacterium]